MDKAKLFSIIKIIWLVAVVAGGIFYIVKNYTIVAQYIQTIEFPRLVASFLLIIIMRTLHPHLVQRSLVLSDSYLDFKRVFSIVSISQLGKYIPGGIWQYVARFSAYRENQLSYKNMGKSFIIENIWLVLGSFFVGIFFIFLGGPALLLGQFNFALPSNIYQSVAFLSIFLWILTLVVTEYWVSSVKRQPPSWLAAFIQFASQTVMWVCLGLSFTLLIHDIGTFNEHSLVAGVFIWSFLAGYLAIFAPGGIGVREYVAVLLLSSLFSSSQIGIATILHRLLYTLAEFLLAGIVLLLNRKTRAWENKPGTSFPHKEHL